MKNEMEKWLKHILQTIKSPLLSSREEDNVSIAALVCQITRHNENKSLPQKKKKCAGSGMRRSIRCRRGPLWEVTSATLGCEHNGRFIPPTVRPPLPIAPLRGGLPPTRRL